MSKTPNLEALGLIPAGELGPQVATEEARRRLADYYARHPLKHIKPGEAGAVELVTDARADGAPRP